MTRNKNIYGKVIITHDFLIRELYSFGWLMVEWGNFWETERLLLWRWGSADNMFPPIWCWEIAHEGSYVTFQIHFYAMENRFRRKKQGWLAPSLAFITHTWVTCRCMFHGEDSLWSSNLITKRPHSMTCLCRIRIRDKAAQLFHSNYSYEILFPPLPSEFLSFDLSV